MYPQVLIGIDAGQSGTVGIICDLDGRLIGRVDRPGVERESSTMGRERTLSVLTDVVESCAALAPDHRIVAAHCSLSAGALAIAHLAPRLLPDAVVETSGDILAATVSGIGMGRGVGVVAGTGSISAYVSEGRITRISGGWGGPIGDSGAGYAVGMEAIRVAVRMEDGRLPIGRMLHVVARHFGIESMREFADRFYADQFPADAIAALVPAVLEADAAGDEHARRIVDETAEGVAALVAAVAVEREAGTELSVVIAGGLLANESRLRRRSIDRITAAVTDVVVLVPEVPPVAGALILAAVAAGVDDVTGFRRELHSELTLKELSRAKGQGA